MDRQAFAPTPLNRHDASGQIARQLRSAIGAGVWEPGERLPSEQELADTFDVARATAREALKLLSATGLVVSQRGAAGGTYVAVPDAEEVADRLSEAIQLWYRVGNVSMHTVDEARTELEAICVQMAARRRTATDVDAIRRPVDAARNFSLPIADWLEHDLDFHTAVTRAAHNKILELAMIAVHASRPTTNAVYVDSLDRQLVWEQHDTIATAISDGDPAAAAAALHQHVGYLREVRDDVLHRMQVDDVVITELRDISPAAQGDSGPA